MSTVHRVLPWRRQGAAASTELVPLLTSFRSHHPKDRVETINRAFHTAAGAHHNQRRSSGESYINHPLAVARIVADIGLDDTSVAAALLHDAVEDTEITLDEVREQFGDEVAGIVDGVTKLDRIRFDSREAQQAVLERCRALGVRLGEPHRQRPALNVGDLHAVCRPSISAERFRRG